MVLVIASIFAKSVTSNVWLTSNMIIGASWHNDTPSPPTASLQITKRPDELRVPLLKNTSGLLALAAVETIPYYNHGEVFLVYKGMSMIHNQQQQQQLPRIVTLSEIEEIVSTKQFAIQLIDAIKKGFTSYSNGEFNACPIQTMGAPPMAPFGDQSINSSTNYAAQTCVKSG